MLTQNLNPGQDTRAEPKLEGHRHEIEHSVGASQDASAHAETHMSQATATLARAHAQRSARTNPSARSSTPMTSGSCCMTAKPMWTR